MGPTRSATCLCLLVAVHAVHVLQVVGASEGQCDNVFKGFSDCLLELGDNMAHYPEELDERENLRKICTYWDDFHSCALTALADCQEGAAELWARLRKDSRRLDFQASLFELCAGPNGASGSEPDRLLLLLPALPALLTRLLF